jgi:hypothetical protein
MQSTHPSILSSKLTSSTPHGINYGGFIDKIELDTKDANIYVMDIKKLDLFDITEKREGRYYTIKFFKDLDISAFYYRNGLIYKLKLNPSSHSNWKCFYNDSKLLWSIFDIYSLKVLRLDLTVDIREKFDVINKGLTVKYKQFVAEFGASGQTGANLGKGNEVFKIYDRMVKNKLPFECTRIEIALKGSKLPSKCFLELIKILANERELKSYNPFKKLITNKIELTESPNRERFLIAKYQLEVITFLRFKKHHDKDRNFYRNYKNIVKVTPHSLQPLKVLEVGLNTFFTNTFNKVENELIPECSLTTKYNKQQPDIRLLNKRSQCGN